MASRFKNLRLFLLSGRQTIDHGAADSELEGSTKPEVYASSPIDALPVETLMAIFEYASQHPQPQPGLSRDRHRLVVCLPKDPKSVLANTHLVKQSPRSPLLPSVKNDAIDPSFIMNLTHVCQRWRDIVTSMPRLWQTLGLGGTDPRGRLEK
ncbi:hypothetical protein FRB93_005330 [Tulasnella sp. JGI-2019a]|nr:hypothetical protein FRB93_005330 [Tulasnella sp. JGI-2019a]